MSAPTNVQTLAACTAPAHGELRSAPARWDRAPAWLRWACAHARDAVARWLRTLAMFAPVLAFVAYAQWHGAPEGARWVLAFRYGGVLAVAHTVAVLALRPPGTPLAHGANLFLFAGGALAWLEQWKALGVFALLQGSAVLVAMLLVGIVTTFATRGGFIARPDLDATRVRRASLQGLAVGVACLGLALAFRGDPTWGAKIPIALLAASLRGLAARAAASTR